MPQKNYQMEFTGYINVTVADALITYVNSEDFKKNFYTLTLSQLLGMIGIQLMDNHKISELDGFGKEHDALVTVDYVCEPSLSALAERIGYDGNIFYIGD